VLTRIGWLSVLLVLARATQAGTAHAEDRAVRLEYAAHQGCPDAVVFFWNTQQRTSHLRPVNDVGAPLVKVTITRKNSASVGILALSGPGVTAMDRRVEAATCDEVVSALALVIVLAFDPDALDAAPPVVAPARSPAPVAAPSVPGAARVVSIPRRERAAAGIRATATTGIAPGLRPTFGPFLAYQSLRDRLVRPRIELGVAIAPDATMATESGEATLGSVGAHLQGCPLEWQLTSFLTAAPCLQISVARLTGEGDPSLEVQHVQKRWWAAGSAVAAFRFSFAERLFLQASAAIGLTLVRAEFVLDGKEAYAVPSVAGEMAFGAGTHF
jgi:hypothetical protein